MSLINNNSKNTDAIETILNFSDVTPELTKAVSQADNSGENKTYIYLDPENPNELGYGYVGVTGATLEERHRWHLKDAEKYPDRPFSKYLRENPSACPVVIARGTHEQMKNIERLLRPHSNMGMNIRAGGSSTDKGKRRMSLSMRGLLWVGTPLGNFASTRQAAKIHGITKTTLSKYCNSEEPEDAGWQYQEDMLVEPCIPCYDPEDDNSKYIEAYHKAQKI